MCLKYLCDLEMAFSVIASRAHGVMFGCHFPTVLLLSLGIVAGDGDGEGVERSHRSGSGGKLQPSQTTLHVSLVE